MRGCCARAESGHTAAAPQSSVMKSRRFNRWNCIPAPTSQARIVRTPAACLLYIALGQPCLQRATAARLQASIPLSNLHLSRANCRQVPISTFWPAVAFCAKADSVEAATRIIVVAIALKKTNVRMIPSLTNAVTGEQGNSQRPQHPREHRLVCSSPRRYFDLMNPSWEFSFDHLVGAAEHNDRSPIDTR
jgi:hypothetical protein